MKLTVDPRSMSLSLPRDGDHHGGEVFSRLARAGLVARGVVYGVIGILSIGLATGAGGKTTSQTGALKTIAQQPFGTVVMVALAIGLAAYAAWRLLEGASGWESGRRASTWHRFGAAFSGVAYALLCGAAVEILAGSSPSGGSAPKATAGVLGWPGGPVYVAIAGIALLGAGVYQAHRGLARSFCEESRMERMSPETRRAFTGLGVAGHVARAVTFLLIGYGMLKAALDYSPRSAVGLDGALQKLIHAPDGPVLLGIVAAGFICFALYSVADAGYHRT